MKRIFINPESNTLRAGWRILAFVAIFIPINLVLTYVVREILGSLKGGGTLWFTLLGISATIAAIISRKYIDKASFISLGLKYRFSKQILTYSDFFIEGIKWMSG